jgi:hypothetical protein
MLTFSVAIVAVGCFAVAAWLAAARYVGYAAAIEEAPMWLARKGMRPGVARTTAAVRNLRQSSFRWFGTTAAGF